ncbi:FAD-dependent oxidoreductase [Geochorda subterranea]|uniref:FAD-dependent oxidoreductase n=1 Tax=Geochorda subterranea TaxID=3109564 RepID=A0ABZ1BME3_9FIRM|nr:FAD-dependent oxidoreductase [Limnochorda sp. LNt]WRP13740.1 FAD-dependent oxidoreductase [Limnochorda sp. LNt]
MQGLSCDVLVIGGGPSGSIAAIAAARAGADVVLVERNGFLGGNATTGLPLLTYHDAMGRQIIRGIPDELVTRLKDMEGSPGHLLRPRRHFGATVTPVEPELVKSVLLEMCLEAGVRLFLHTSCLDPIMEGESVRGALFVNKGGRFQVGARVVIDATGDGDVAAAAGCSYDMGNKGKNMPATLMFRLHGVDTDDVARFMDEELIYGHKIGEDKESVVCIQGNFGPWDDLVKEESLFPDARHAIWFTSVRRNLVDINVTRILGIDSTSTDGLTKAEIEGRRQMHRIVDFMRRHIPPFRNAELVQAASFVGVRESRHFAGEATLTSKNVMDGTVSDDAIALGAYAIDIHDPEGRGILLEATAPTAYGIPYGACIPRGADGILIGGRSIAADSRAFSTVRVMATCMAIGQGLGVAAAIAARRGISPREVPLDELRETLQQQGAFLG